MATFLLQLQVAAREPYRYLLSEGGLCYIWLHKIGEYDILTIAACRYLITAEEQIGAFSCFDKKKTRGQPWRQTQATLIKKWHVFIKLFLSAP